MTYIPLDFIRGFFLLIIMLHFKQCETIRITHNLFNIRKHDNYVNRNFFSMKKRHCLKKCYVFIRNRKNRLKCNIMVISNAKFKNRGNSSTSMFWIYFSPSYIVTKCLGSIPGQNRNFVVNKNYLRKWLTHKQIASFT